jgi:hypothetical protein
MRVHLARGAMTGTWASPSGVGTRQPLAKAAAYEHLNAPPAHDGEKSAARALSRALRSWESGIRLLQGHENGGNSQRQEGAREERRLFRELGDPGACT